VITARPRTVAVIPARMGSSRYPGKPLAPILGLAMIEHVRRRTLLCPVVDDVVVATCDPEIADVVAAAGGRAVMTADTHVRCTTRVEEAMGLVAGDVVVIVQGDEPLIRPAAIAEVVVPLHERPDVDCTNLLSRLTEDADFADVDIVKAATDRRGFIMYFSRAPIPHFRHKAACPIYRQMGIMAFRRPFLRMYTTLPETPFELVEAVDMLRLLEHGHRILGVPTSYATVGVDHAEDVARVEAVLRGDPEQRGLYERIAGGVASRS
jgi:3-deoxy-manno-octulosonate cytidylyltransferase (CMP-KDO synthetase)